ncbi:AAA family ATPase [Azohydromonas caseinilytica]|uniref:AAA family ATPase n=1 Tax=Azohydromonas caseinilytica TaxID=2728836 RepID=A0A848F9T9_9BURK|nr:AAA family ATPase [Azohydromonas caseinilytica]NML15616.1 AAA family ATPase [Azohydromonas caseinilytica]
MKLQRLRIEQFKQFRQPLELVNLEPGLNLFTGPNESGKSTIVRAIRAAFFERYRSSSVKELQPWGDGGASPCVELDFETGGSRYRLHKQFLQRKRCRLQVDALALENDDAEQRLCELLGFQLAQRGESKPEHWGIPGLLWIEQGGSHQIRDEVQHATDHLRTALQGSLGEVASTAGDDVLSRVREQRNELLTEKKGEPRGPYLDALRQRDELQAALQDTQQRLAQYREQVDRLGQVQAEIALDEAERPWEPFQRQRQEAQQQLDALQLAAEQLQRQREQLAPLDRQIALLQQQIDAHAQQQRALAQREQALGAALQAQELAAQRLEPARRRAQDARQAQLDAQALLERVRAQQWRASLRREQDAAAQRVRTLDTALAEAQAHGTELARLREELQRQALDAAQLKELRALEQRWRELELRREAAATQLRWHFNHAGAAPRLDGEPLEGKGGRLLLQPAVLELPGFGQVTVTPGGADLEKLAAQLADAMATLEALRRRLGVETLAEAEARHERQRVLAGRIETLQALLAQLAPRGVPALQAERDELQGRIAALEAQIAALPAADADANLPPLAQAEQSLKDAARQWEQAQAAAQQAQSALAQAQGAVEHAQREREALRLALESEEARQALERAQAERLALLRQREDLESLLRAKQADIEAARPELLKQDVLRLSRSAEVAYQQYQERRREREALQIRLDEAGAQGLEDALATQRAALERSQRHCGELQRRAQALDLLLNLLNEKRRALTQRLQAPLQKHLNRYLALLFPRARVELDETLMPGPLRREGNGSLDGEGGSFEQLSFGAREQMGLISRLAYADLLKEAGRPTLILLDDALVHSDAGRLAAMKRILFDAATRHQILVFSCHPEAWRDLGVAARSIEALRRGS